MLLVPTVIFKELSKNIYKFRDKSRDQNSDDGSQVIYNTQELSMTAIRDSKQISPIAVSFSLFDRRYVLYADGHVSEDLLSMSAFRNIGGKDSDFYDENTENVSDEFSSVYFLNGDESLIKIIISFLKWRLKILQSIAS